MTSNGQIKVLEQLNQELEALNKELESIFESSYDEIFVVDGNGIALRVNSACERNYGLKAAEIIGKSVFELEKTGIFTPSVTREVFEKKERVNLIQKTKAGRHLLVAANPVFNNEGELIRVVCNSRDLTEVLKLKKQLDEKEKLIKEYNDQLKEMKEKQEKQATYTEVIYESTQMQKIVELIEKLALVDSTVLLLGESGVGKTLLAKKIHDRSSRKKEKFYKLNCGAIPENLIESELFGYEEGSFSGAKKGGKKGIIEYAHKGTLFLDEIGELPFNLQVKLLHVLQEKTFQRIGGTEDIAVDVRIIAATNKDLQEMVKEKRFREDLYYRLNVIPIDIPPLRERKEDIYPLIKYYLDKVNEKYNKYHDLDPRTISILLDYEWPGNIRELENMIERLIVTADEEVITPDQLPNHLFVEEATKNDNEDISLKEWLEVKEKEIIETMYNKYNSSYKVAEVLKISQSSANRKIRKYRAE